MHSRFGVQRTFARCITALLAVVASAQVPSAARSLRPPRVLVLAHGASEPQNERWALARNDAELQAVLVRWQIEVKLPAVDYTTGAVVLVSYGRGRGGQPTVSSWCWGEDPSMQLVRLAGDPTASVERGRWAALQLPHSFQPWRGNIRFETDAPGEKVGVAWRSVCMPCHVSGAEHLGFLPLRSQPIACFQDDSSWRSFCRRELADDVVVPDCDFATHVLVTAPIRRKFGTGVLTGAFRTMLRVVEPAGKESARSVAVIAVPRCSGELVVEATDPDDSTRHRIVARFVVTDPSSAVLLRRFECVLEAREELLCARATTQSQWQVLRKKVGGAVAAMTNDWCDFSLDTVVVLATDAVAVRSDFGLSVSEEEGVDVLTVKQVAAAAAQPSSFALVLKVPRRKGQLAVVLRREGLAASPSEATVGVFPGF
ncbi:MAG: hypothetical protein ABIP94_10705 [Planctomycetota bacterium]